MKRRQDKPARPAPEARPDADLQLSGSGRLVLKASGQRLDAAGTVRADRRRQSRRVMPSGQGTPP
jgi:hypothetical protein